MLDDKLIYPILDLIRQEIYRFSITGDSVSEGGGGTSEFFDPFAGYPSITLERNHPDDVYKVFLTEATLTYETEWSVKIELKYENDNQTGKQWILKTVIISAYSPTKELVTQYSISINYDERWLLESTTAIRTAGRLIRL